MTQPRRRLLSTNSELRPIGVWTWSIPALADRLDDGRTVSTCPNAGACASVCYARNGTFRFPVVKAAHRRNLVHVLDDLLGWQMEMTKELQAKKFRPTGSPRLNAAPDLDAIDPWLQDWAQAGGQAVRIHDGGDFFSDEYLLAWIDIARRTPDVLFYAYTKEVSRFRLIAEGHAPQNFRWIFSMGGKEDHLIDKDRERHADVFPDEISMELAGYSNQDESDLWAITLPTTRIGVPQNNIAHFKKKLAGRTFAQAEDDRRNRRTAND